MLNSDIWILNQWEHYELIITFSKAIVGILNRYERIKVYNGSLVSVTDSTTIKHSDIRKEMKIPSTICWVRWL